MRAHPHGGAPVVRGYRVLRLGAARTGWVLPLRLVVVSAAVAAAAALLALASMCLGDYPLALGEVLEVVCGGGGAFERIVVLQWRAPIAVAAVVFGAVLGLGGAIFQSLMRNPLGSPDVIGFDAGSYTAVVVTMLVLGAGAYWSIAAASLAGGLLTAVVVYLLSYRRGIQGFRLIVVGIGVASFLGAINAYLVTRADIKDAMAVGMWSAGSITRVTWPSMIPSLAAALVITVVGAALAPSLHRLELGDDAATTLGIRVHAARAALLVVGVATVALVTAAAGPIGFVALAAPQVARRLTRSPGVSLLAACATGALLLSAAHLLSLLIGQVYRPIPVGLLTVTVGGAYLIRLLVHELRAGAGQRVARSRPRLAPRMRS